MTLGVHLITCNRQNLVNKWAEKELKVILHLTSNAQRRGNDYFFMKNTLSLLCPLSYVHNLLSSSGFGAEMERDPVTSFQWKYQNREFTFDIEITQNLHIEGIIIKSNSCVPSISEIFN